MLESIVTVLGLWQPTQPVAWLVTYWAAKVGSQNSICHLGLIVSLQVVGGAHPRLNTREAKQL
jgi:hypothetical protein